MRVSFFILPLFAVVFAGCATPGARIPVTDIGVRSVILGDLRRPIGQEVTIHGYKFTNGPYRDCFRVETVDGERLAPSTYVHIRGIAAWPDKTVATIRGYETGTIRYLHIEDTNYFDESDLKPHQTIFLRFEALKIIEPAGISLGEDR